MHTMFHIHIAEVKNFQNMKVIGKSIKGSPYEKNWQVKKSMVISGQHPGETINSDLRRFCKKIMEENIVEKIYFLLFQMQIQMEI